MSWGTKITYLGETAVRERTVPYGIKDADRTSHVCVVGRAGTGRETLVGKMILQDIRRGFGVLVLDAGGMIGTHILERLTKDEASRVVYVDASDAEYPYAFAVATEFRNAGAYGKKLCSEYLASIYGIARTKLVDDATAKILNDTQLTPTSLFDLVEQSEEALSMVGEPEQGGEGTAEPGEPPEPRPEPALAIVGEQETAAMILENGVYVRKDTFVRNVLGQPDGLFTLSQLHEGAIIIVDVSRIRMFPTRMAPVVRTFVYGARAAAAAGNDVAKLYMHDCLRYLSESDAEGLMNDRAVALTLADTIYREEDMPLREKSLSRCGTVFTFQPHPADSPLVEKSFFPFITSTDLQQLEDGEGIVMLNIDGVRSKPFFTRVSALGERTDVSVQDVIGESRKRYARSRNVVEEYFRPKPKPRPPRKKPDSEEGGGKKERKRQGGFSDAFRAIFEQQAGGTEPAPQAPAPDTGAAAPAAPDQKPAISLPFPGEAPKAGQQDKPVHVDENMLATLLYVPRPA